MASNSDDLEITYPTYCALCCWGIDGLRSIEEISLIGKRVCHRSAAITLFASISETSQVLESISLPVDQGLLRIVNNNLKSNDLSKFSQEILGRMIRKIPIDEVLNPISQSFIQIYMNDNHQLSRAIVGALSSRWLEFGPVVLDKYEQLLRAEAVTEAAFQKFFETYPQFLDPYAIEVWAKPDFHGLLEPDFLIRRTDNTYLIVEIEKPSKMLVTKSNQLASVATQAEQQALDYRAFLDERAAQARVHFRNYSSADCLTVIGLEGKLNDSQSKALRLVNENRGKSKIVGFDTLLKRSESIVQNVGTSNIQVIKKFRMV